MKDTFLKNLKNKSVVIVTHEGTTGPSHDLRDFFLNEKIRQLLFIAHPLLFLPENYKKRSRWEFYKNGQKSEGKAQHFIFPEIFAYIKDCFYTLFWVLRKSKKTNVYVGVGNINAFIGILLKKIGFVDSVIFYCIDYVPQRFTNRLINSLYHLIDKWTVEGSTVTWNLSPRMIEGRREKWKNITGRQIVVPIGIWYDRIVNNTEQKVNPHELIYLGTILEKQGLDMCIEALKDLRKTIKDISLTIIGSGPYRETLEALIKKNKVESLVTWLGYIPNHADVEKRLSQASLAIALYNPYKDIFTYYADPGKVKSYLACGLPVLITNIPYIAQEAANKKCAIVVDYDKNDIIEKIKEFFSDTSRIHQFKMNAKKFVKAYNWNSVFTKALEESFG